MHHPLPTLSATRMAAMIRAQETTPTDLLEAHFEQVDKVNPAINAVIWQDRDAARQHAGILDAEARAGTYRGPLHGVPITVKEAFDLPGSPSTWGNPKLAENYPDAPALVVQRYRDAGANIFGKTNVPLDLGDWQSFNKIYGTTNNPWDVTRTPGGSSGGSAAALATGMAALEAGSDIGSSIRNPAHYCGVFGLKPTHGVIPLQGHAPPGFTGDIDIAVTGPMARAAEDLKMGFDILLGADDLRCNAWRPDCPPDPRTKLSEFRVGVMLGDDISPVATSYLDALQTFSEALEKAGATVTYNTRPDVNSEEHFVLYMRLLGAAMAFGHDEASAANMASIASALPHGRHRQMQLARLEGVRASHRDWQMLDNERRRARAKFDAYFAEWDILIAPVCASAAFVQDEHPVRAQRNLMINGQAQPEALQLFWSGYSGVVELPSVVGPAGFDAGLPVGYQAIAGFGRDRTALAFASAVEREIIGFTPPPAYR